MKNKEKLEQNLLAGKERYYYLDYGKKGKATVCIIPYESCGGTGYVRGISFCNPLDLYPTSTVKGFNKCLGRNKALGRAIKAIEWGIDSEEIPWSTPAKILKSFWGDTRTGFVFLSAFNVQMTELEERILAIRIKREVKS